MYLTRILYFWQGGFASCYELITGNDRATLAGKVISKTLMTKQHQRDKITQEIQIHKQLKHKNIVGFYSFFEDSANIYIVLELCKYKVNISVIYMCFYFGND